MKTKLFLVRNAECEGNINNILGESNNFKITEHGKKTIEVLTEYFKNEMIYNIYSSESTMCIETVDKIAQSLNIKIKIENELREKSFGIYDGKNWDEIIKEQPELKKFRKKKIEILGIPNQESTKQVADRMLKIMEKIAEENLGQNVIVVSHGVAIETFLRVVVGIPYSEEKDKYFQKNAAINVVIYDDEFEVFEVKEVAKIIY
ncbi:MAG: histidine phosphatase family protein [Clostridia bacterium]|nr:histidine phosphatase family protein [Clostridia bacterium]